MADNKDKITMQDYLDFFGGKSAEADDIFNVFLLSVFSLL